MNVFLVSFALVIVLIVYYKEFVKPTVYEHQIKGDIPYKFEPKKPPTTIQDDYKNAFKRKKK